MSQGNILLKNTVIYAIGNFGSRVFSFVLLPFYSYYLTKAQLGLYDLLITTLNLLLPIISLQVADSVYRWLLDSRTNVKQQLSIIKQAFVIIISSLVIFELLFCIVGYFYPIPYKNLFSILMVSACLFPLIQQIVRGIGNNKLYSISGVINSGLLFLFSMFFLFTNYVEDKVEGILISIILANVITFVCVFIFIKVDNKKMLLAQVDTKLQLSMLKYSFPLIFNTISWWIINASDRFIILKFMHIEDNGIYAVSSRLPALLTIINSIFMLAWQDMVITNNDKYNPFFTKLFDAFFVFVISVSLILISISPLLIYYLFDEKFYGAWRYTPFLFLGAAFSSLSAFVGSAYLKVRKTKGIFVTSLVAAMVNVVISLIFIKYIGLYAPALGSFVSFVIMFIMRLYQTRNMMIIKINIAKMFGLSLFSILFIALLIWFGNNLIVSVLSVFSLIFFLYLNQGLFKILKDKIILIIRQ